MESISPAFPGDLLLFGILGALYYIRMGHIHLGKMNYSPAYLKGEMNCVYDSEIIFRHMRVIHRNSHWLRKGPFLVTWDKYRYADCTYIYSCTKIFSPLEENRCSLVHLPEQVVMCSRAVPKGKSMWVKEATGKLGLLPPPPFCPHPPPHPSSSPWTAHPRTCENTQPSRHQAQVLN